MAPSLGGWRKALPSFKLLVIPKLLFYFQESVNGQLRGQSVSKREKHQGGKEHMNGMEGCQTLPSLQFKRERFPDLPLN